ncbi:MAG: recombination protein RecR [Planctomycetota bacterium]|jgi:recombination protein RecR|nr:recombination mediator RecR [Planctomycetia bacterium]RLS64095.1 MAG: recombination protein RecR [Planctomycetota bacterium]
MAEARGAIAKLVEAFADLPGIGRKSAERLAYHVLRMPIGKAVAFAQAIRAVKENLRPCKICFNLAEGEQCDICLNPRRNQTILCIVEQVRDLLALEQAGSYQGLYHVLQGRISPLEGIDAGKLTIDALVERVNRGAFHEVIMGTNPNVEGDATALVITQRLAGLPINFTRLARGLTVGGALEHANQEMLAAALSGRQKL